ncbi:GLPGLI family protein [Pedobacter aquatilis]|uniref:GLPGLI family protein n=1 Tax=Pedobacter aquatilis TaxID=351343 RepID=UPI0025B52312|nr:GLPGLI family protein [Pedobacter aquatilis]MDN3586843.1 GLPGLI family protein [Pedobacter aquatilis]
MKTIAIIIFLNSFHLFCKAQVIDSAFARIFYIMNHKCDTLNKDSVYKENMILLVGKNASIFSSYDKIKQAKNIKEQALEQAKNRVDNNPIKYKVTGLTKIYTDEIFQHQAERKRFIKEFLVRNYLYEEPLEEIDWNLTSETKNFRKIITQKATATYKGRQWIAWFAPDIPFSTGPWKLHGLPGLIIEAYDKNREIEFLFSGFESVISSKSQSDIFSYDKSAIITLPKKVITVSISEINKLKDSMYKNPKVFTLGQLLATGGFADDDNDMLGMSYSKINNPIELPVK